MTSENSRRAAELLKKGYTRRLTPDETGGYTATILELPGCVADGDTAQEALDNLERVAESWIDVALANGQTVRDPVDFEGCSGKLALRMPRSLHKQAAEMAELEGCSLNQLLVTAIAHYIGGKRLVSDHEWMERRWSANVTVNNLIVTATSSAPTPKVHNLSASTHAIESTARETKIGGIDIPTLPSISADPIQIGVTGLETKIVNIAR